LVQLVVLDQVLDLIYIGLYLLMGDLVIHVHGDLRIIKINKGEKL